MAEESPREEVPEVSAEDSDAIFEELRKQGLKTEAESADGSLSRQNTRIFEETGMPSAVENMEAVHEDAGAGEDYADDFEESADQMGEASRQNTEPQGDDAVANANTGLDEKRTENLEGEITAEPDPYDDSSIKESQLDQTDPYPDTVPAPENVASEDSAPGQNYQGTTGEDEVVLPETVDSTRSPDNHEDSTAENNGDTANIMEPNSPSEKRSISNHMNGVADADLLFDAVADNVFSVVEGEEIKDMEVEGNSPFTWNVEFGDKLLKLDGSITNVRALRFKYVMIFYAALKCPHSKAAVEGIDKIVMKINSEHGENSIESIMVTPEEKTQKGALDVAADCKYNGYVMDVESYAEHLQNLVARMPVRGYPTVPVINNMRDVITSDAAGFLTLNNYYTWWSNSSLRGLDEIAIDMEKYATALEDGDEDKVWEMIKGGAPVGGKITKQEDDVEITSTPILLAKKNLTIVAMLLQNGASPYDVDSDGNTVLLSACNGGDIDMINVLLVNGLDLNYIPPKSYKGFGPLHACCSNLETECAKYLLKMGANPALKSADGKSPRDILQDFFYDEELDNELLDYERMWVQKKRNR